MTDTEKRLAEIREREPYTDINGRKIKFGDKVVNGHASQDNPTRCGIFVQWTTCNGATCAKCTDGRGHFWNVLHDKDDLLEVIECREDEADKLRSEIDRLTAEIGRYQQWVNDLHSGMYVNCVYCGHRYGPAEGTPVSMADVLKSHVEQCPEHPMSRLTTELAALKEAIAKAGEMNPYKQPGNRDSYSSYNEGWQDAVDYIEARMPLPAQPEKEAE